MDAQLSAFLLGGIIGVACGFGIGRRGPLVGVHTTTNVDASDVDEWHAKDDDDDGDPADDWKRGRDDDDEDDVPIG